MCWVCAHVQCACVYAGDEPPPSLPPAHTCTHAARIHHRALSPTHTRPLLLSAPRRQRADWRGPAVPHAGQGGRRVLQAVCEACTCLVRVHSVCLSGLCWGLRVCNKGSHCNRGRSVGGTLPGTLHCMIMCMAHDGPPPTRHHWLGLSSGSRKSLAPWHTRYHVRPAPLPRTSSLP